VRAVCAGAAGLGPSLLTASHSFTEISPVGSPGSPGSDVLAHGPFIVLHTAKAPFLLFGQRS